MNARWAKAEKKMLLRTRTVGLESQDEHLPLAKDAEGAKEAAAMRCIQNSARTRAIRRASAIKGCMLSCMPAAGHEQAMLGWRVEWLPDMDWFAGGKSLRDRAVRAPSPLRFVELRSHPCRHPNCRAIWLPDMDSNHD